MILKLAPKLTLCCLRNNTANKNCGVNESPPEGAWAHPWGLGAEIVIRRELVVQPLLHIEMNQLWCSWHFKLGGGQVSDPEYSDLAVWQWAIYAGHFCSAANDSYK